MTFLCPGRMKSGAVVDEDTTVSSMTVGAVITLLTLVLGVETPSVGPVSRAGAAVVVMTWQIWSVIVAVEVGMRTMTASSGKPWKRRSLVSSREAAAVSGSIVRATGLTATGGHTADRHLCHMPRLPETLIAMETIATSHLLPLPTLRTLTVWHRPRRAT